MNKYKINLTSQFIEELDKILYFSLYSQKTVKKLYDKIKNSVLSLDFLPERHYRISNMKKYKNLNIRRLPIDNYIIIYEVNNNTRSSFCFTYISSEIKIT